MQGHLLETGDLYCLHLAYAYGLANWVGEELGNLQEMSDMGGLSRMWRV